MSDERKRSREGYFSILAIDTLTLCPKSPLVMFSVWYWNYIGWQEIRYSDILFLDKWKCEGGARLEPRYELRSLGWIEYWVLARHCFCLRVTTELPPKPKLCENKSNSGQNFAYCAYFPFKGCVVCTSSSLWRSDWRHTKAFISFNRFSKRQQHCQSMPPFYVSQFVTHWINR